ncbi:MAG TPA: cyclopropane-fatty-acyl-phospholipid synthase family protein [Candidatus Hydrogenedentes bacterium]|nr:cyclopropane-fatty-acyl-phospholipid synthase family protein [Candidatus Hydrogenedentota bacterium]
MGNAMWQLLTRWVDEGKVPDFLVRAGIRRLLRAREKSMPVDAGDAAFLASLYDGPIAIAVDRANEQHYELPSAFFEAVLGPRLKYSCCLFPTGVESLAEAEEKMLALTAVRARLEDGQRILELGCGWGSLSLWMAERFPGSRVLAVSNSSSQRAFILDRASQRGLTNLDVVTRDMNEFDPGGERFDRVVSVEMFEHMRCWRRLLERIRGWLKPDGRLFLHVFCHREYAYPYEIRDASDWMARYFFTGGMMPSWDLAFRMGRQAGLEPEDRWMVNGGHYGMTCRRWLERMDAARPALAEVFQAAYGADAPTWWQRWRIFHMACEELFRWRGGNAWFVGHYRLRSA